MILLGDIVIEHLCDVVHGGKLRSTSELYVYTYLGACYKNVVCLVIFSKMDYGYLASIKLAKLACPFSINFASVSIII